MNGTEIKLKHFQKNLAYESLLISEMKQKSYPLEGSAENTYLLRWAEDTETRVVPGTVLKYEHGMNMVIGYCIMKETGGIFSRTGKP